MTRNQYVERLKSKGYKIINENQVLYEIFFGKFIFDIQEREEQIADVIQNTFCMTLSSSQRL